MSDTKQPRFKPNQKVVVWTDKGYRVAVIIAEGKWYNKGKCFGYECRWLTDTEVQSGGIRPSQGGWVAEQYIKNYDNV